MKKLFMHKRALVVSVVAILAVTATAIAYWTTTGSGTGSGSVKEENGTITLSGTVDAPLAPGEDSDVTILASNPGNTDLWVTSTTLSNIDALAVGCVDTDFSETAGVVAQGVNVLAGAVDQELPTKHNIAFANDAVTSQDDCKGTTLSFDLDSD